MIRVLHTIHSLDPDGGGPSRTVPALCDALAATAQVRVTLLTTDRPGGSNLRPDRPEVEMVELPRSTPAAGLTLQRAFTAAIVELHAAGPFHLIHDHGQWLATNRAATRASRRLRLPRVVSPRGMLSPWARSHRRLVKSLMWRLHARQDLNSAALLHATSDLEADELRSLAVRPPIAVIPNGISFPEHLPAVEPAQSPRELLFLSRIHPKKGLPELVEAWARIRPVGWRVVIAGPDDGGHRRDVERLIDQHRLTSDFEFVGSVDDEQKWRLYRRASLFVLPSHSENFGVVVAEALAAGVPVITTRVTPWSALEQHRCGWWVPDDVNRLTAALRSALSQSPVTLTEMGCRGARFARDTFGWAAIGESMLGHYRQCIAGVGANNLKVECFL